MNFHAMVLEDEPELFELPDWADTSPIHVKLWKGDVVDVLFESADGTVVVERFDEKFRLNKDDVVILKNGMDLKDAFKLVLDMAREGMQRCDMDYKEAAFFSKALRVVESHVELNF